MTFRDRLVRIFLGGALFLFGLAAMDRGLAIDNAAWCWLGYGCAAFGVGLVLRGMWAKGDGK